MRKKALTLMLLLIATFANAQTILKGDMNDDGDITISDAVDIVNIVLGNSPRQTINISGSSYFVDNSMVVGTWFCSDGTTLTLNDDGTTDYGDGYTYKFRPSQGTILFSDADGKPIKTLVMNEVEDNYMLSVDYATGTYKLYKRSTTFSSAHGFVDLGLPSGTLWATCNVGAESPEEFGDMFAWGETEGFLSGKTVFSWSTYKWCEGTQETLTKYCTDSSYGVVDNISELAPEDDAAYVLWGPSWRMPTAEQLKELFDNTTRGSTYVNGVYCHKLTSKINGNCMYLNRATFDSSKKTIYDGVASEFWSRTLRDAKYPNSAQIMYLNGAGGSNRVSNSLRYLPLQIRPVINSK